MHSLPARVLLMRTGRPWRDASTAQIEGFLRRAQHSRVFLLRRIYDFLYSMSVIGWFDLPDAWGAMGYPGPPVQRPLVRSYGRDGGAS